MAEDSDLINSLSISLVHLKSLDLSKQNRIRLKNLNQEFQKRELEYTDLMTKYKQVSFLFNFRDYSNLKSYIYKSCFITKKNYSLLVYKTYFTTNNYLL